MLIHTLELSAGQPKLKSNDVVGEVAKKWNVMDIKTKVAITDPLIDELVASRKEIETKAKIAPVHVLNDVSATMGKITREVRHWQQSARVVGVLTNIPYLQLDALYARTGFETIVFGVRSSADHYTAPMVHATSSKIPKFFDLIIKKPAADLATSIEAFCLSGVDGESAPAGPDRHRCLLVSI